VRGPGVPLLFDPQAKACGNSGYSLIVLLNTFTLRKICEEEVVSIDS
jgi:hypothetical protein